LPLRVFERHALSRLRPPKSRQIVSQNSFLNSTSQKVHCWGEFRQDSHAEEKAEGYPRGLAEGAKTPRAQLGLPKDIVERR